MCGCALKASLASIPARSIMRANPAGLNGAPRSDVNTNADLDSCSRWEPPQGAQFVTKDRMGAWGALFDPADVQISRFELDLIPAQVHEFGSTQAVAVSHEDHGGVSVAPPVSLARIHEPLDLSLGEVLARPQVAIGRRRGLTVRFTVAALYCAYLISFANVRGICRRIRHLGTVV
jgi:hypothetical protein